MLSFFLVSVKCILIEYVESLVLQSFSMLVFELNDYFVFVGIGEEVDEGFGSFVDVFEDCFFVFYFVGVYL